MGILTQRRVTVAVVVVVLALVGWFGWVRTHPAGMHFSADFAGSVGLYPGSDVRMLGVQVGKVDHVQAHGTVVTVSMTLDHGKAAAAGTGAVILSPSLVSDRYVQLTAIWSGGPKLTAGTHIPVSRTATPVELDQLYSSLTQFADALGPQGANSHGALTQLLNVSAANLKGNGAAFNQTLNRVSQASATLSNSQDNLFATVNNLKVFTTTLAQNDKSVSGLNTQLAAVSQVLAADRQSFTAAIQQLGSALTLVQGFIQNNRSVLTTDVQQLSTITAALSTEKASLAQALATAPQALQNVLNAYDPAHNTLDGRGDLNEISIWAAALGASGTAQTSSATAGTAAGGSATTAAAVTAAATGSGSGGPPMLLPGSTSAGPSIGGTSATTVTAAGR